VLSFQVILSTTVLADEFCGDFRLCVIFVDFLETHSEYLLAVRRSFLIALICSVDYVRLSGPGHREEGNKGPAPRGRRHQIRNTTDQVSVFFFSQPNSHRSPITSDTQTIKFFPCHDNKQTSQHDVTTSTDEKFEYDAEMATSRDIQFRVSHVPEHDSR
jgi:hypothetical protein